MHQTCSYLASLDLSKTSTGLALFKIISNSFGSKLKLLEAVTLKPNGANLVGEQIFYSSTYILESLESYLKKYKIDKTKMFIVYEYPIFGLGLTQSSTQTTLMDALIFYGQKNRIPVASFSVPFIKSFATKLTGISSEVPKENTIGLCNLVYKKEYKSDEADAIVCGFCFFVFYFRYVKTLSYYLAPDYSLCSVDFERSALQAGAEPLKFDLESSFNLLKSLSFCEEFIKRGPATIKKLHASLKKNKFLSFSSKMWFPYHICYLLEKIILEFKEVSELKKLGLDLVRVFKTTKKHLEYRLNVTGGHTVLPTSKGFKIFPRIRS